MPGCLPGMAIYPLTKSMSLPGFILSPGGSQLFNTNCGSCHKVEDLVGGNPLDLKNSIDEGLNFHSPCQS